MALKIRNLEGDFWEVIESIISGSEPVLIEETPEFQIWQEPTFTYIPVLNLDIHSATCHLWDEDTQEYEIDSDQYNFYNHATGEQVYTESGSTLSVCIYNYCHIAHLDEWHDLDRIEDLECIYVLAKKP